MYGSVVVVGGVVVVAVFCWDVLRQSLSRRSQLSTGRVGLNRCRERPCRNGIEIGSSSCARVLRRRLVKAPFCFFCAQCCMRSNTTTASSDQVGRRKEYY